MRTPWGIADQVESYERGIVAVQTPSHGGYIVREAIGNTFLSNEAKEIGNAGYALMRGHYCFEEDCDWVVLEWEHAGVREKSRQLQMQFATGERLRQISTPDGYIATLRATLYSYHKSYLATNRYPK